MTPGGRGPVTPGAGRPGRLLSVRTTRLGSELTTPTPAGSTVLPVADLTDFDATGGWVEVGGQQLQYTGVDPAGGVVLLGEPTTADTAADDTVSVWDPTAGEPATELAAQVLPDGDDPTGVTLTATVMPHLRPFLAGGAGEGLPAVLVQRGEDGTLMVTGLPGHTPVFEYPAAVRGYGSGSSLAGLDGDGNIHAVDYDVTGVLRAAASAVVLDGTPLDQTLTTLGRGVWGWGERDPQVSGISTTGYGVLGMPLYLPEDRRVQVEVETTLTHSGALASRFNTVLRSTYDPGTDPVEPDGSSPVLAAFPMSSAVGPGLSAGYSDTRRVVLAAGYYRVRVELRTIVAGDTLSTSGVTGVTVTDRGPAYPEDNQGYKPAAPGSLPSGGTDTGPATTPGTRMVRYLYNATWSRSYAGNGSQIAGDFTMFVGQANTGEGNRSTAIGFNDTQIRRDLTGSRITLVELFCYADRRPGTDPGTLVVGFHGDSNPSATWGAVGGRNPDQQRAPGWREGTGRWVDITGPTPGGWVSGTRRGVILTGPTNATQWAFWLFGPTRPRNTPTLRFTVER